MRSTSDRRSKKDDDWFYGRLGIENAVREGIRHRQRFCRMCGREIDFANDPGVMRDVRHVNYDDGRRRLEMFAFCTRDCRAAYVTWEETQ